MKSKILYVDDEQQNLTIFTSLLRRKYKVLTSLTVSGANELLAEYPDIKVVIADERMPEQRGIEFLESVKNNHPGSIRILLTAFADKETLDYAINKSNISYFVEKPWNEGILEITIENAVDLYESRQVLKLKNTELQKANDALTRLVYSASHEMRAPLTNILGIVKVSRIESDHAQLKEYFDLVETSVLQLDEFIKNLIGYYKNTRVENDYREIDMSKLVNDIIRSFQFIEGASAIRYNVNIVQDERLVSDETRLKMIIMNLISNAIKFQKNDGTQAEISIDIMVQNNQAEIKIGDNGIGMTPKEQEKIFGMFNKSTHPRSGSGIGLFIVKEAVEKLDGKIYLNSVKGKGTDFEIILANKKVDTNAEAQAVPVS
jgi:two-component system sensor histidine kinase/response regulator